MTTTRIHCGIIRKKPAHYFNLFSPSFFHQILNTIYQRTNGKLLTRDQTADFKQTTNYSSQLTGFYVLYKKETNPIMTISVCSLSHELMKRLHCLGYRSYRSTSKYSKRSAKEQKLPPKICILDSTVISLKPITF